MTRPLRLLVALGILSGLATAATLGCVVGWWRERRGEQEVPPSPPKCHAVAWRFAWRP